MSYTFYMHEKKEKDVPLALRVPEEIARMIEGAKQATGKSKKHLLSEAIRAKYAKYLPEPAEAA